MIKAIYFIASFFMMLSVVAQNDNPNQSGIKASQTGMYKGTENAKANAYFENAITNANKGKYKTAAKLYLKAIKQDNNFVEAYDNLGRVYRVLGDYDKAIKYYKKSIELYPKGDMAHQNLAIVYNIQKNYKGAIHEYEVLTENSPENAEGYYGLANTYMILGQYEKALVNVKVAIDIYKEEKSKHLPDGYYMAGIINYYKKDDKEAVKYLSLAKQEGVTINQVLVDKYFKADNGVDIELKEEDDYDNSEEKFIESYEWLLTTPVNQKESKRKDLNKFVLEWVMGSPTVTIELNEKILSYMDCGDCLVIFMGAWSKYAIETQKYKDTFGGNLAGTKAVLQFYKANKDDLGKNKEIEKLIKLDDSGELEAYIKKNI